MKMIYSRNDYLCRYNLINTSFDMIGEFVITKASSVKADGLISPRSSGTTYVLNTNRINGLLTRATTKSKFKYNFNLFSRREVGTYMECDSTVAAIVVVADTTWASTMVPLYYFPPDHTINEPDITATPVLIYLHSEGIAICWADHRTAERSWVNYYDGSGKEHLILVNHRLDQIVDIADTGTSSTV